MCVMKLRRVFITMHLWIAAMALGEGTAGHSLVKTWTTPGVHWLIRVKQYNRGAEIGHTDPKLTEQARQLRVQYEFFLKVDVLEPIGNQEEQIARIRFSPMEDAPPDVKGQVYVLQLDANSGKPLKLELVEGKWPGSITIERAGDQQFVLTNLFGFPADWIVDPSDVTLIPTHEVDRGEVIDGTTVQLSKTLRPVATEGHANNATEVDVSLPPGGSVGNGKRVVQIWIAGETWWRTFKRYQGDRLDLEAECIR